jgi:O-antigen/teichoic acid export membrane protein
MMIGYFGVFDLGLSRTLTKMVADRVGTPKEVEVPSLIVTTVTIVTACSGAVSIVLAAGAKIIAEKLLHVPPLIIGDVSNAIVWLAVSLPFVLISTVLFGVLEGFQRFAVTSSVRLPLGVLMFLVPLGVLSFDNHLGAITAALTVVRVAALFVLAWLTGRIVPGLRPKAAKFRSDQVRPLITFGGWLTVSNIVGPLLVYFDRFVIAAILGTAAIAYYTVPYDALSRLLILPTAIQGVLFPAFAALRALSPERVVAVFRRSSEKTVLLMMPAVLAVTLFAGRGLHVWLGSGFAQESATVAKILIMGVFINGLARAPFVLVQGYGYAKWTALLHLVELPLYAICLWVLLKKYGINGAAIAWTCRVVADTVAVYIMAGRLERSLGRTVIRDAVWIMAVCLGAIGSDIAVHQVVVRAALVAAVTLCCGLILIRDLKAALFVSDIAASSGPSASGR